MAEPIEGARLEGKLDAGGMRFVLVAARFNGFVVDRLIAGARDALERLGCSPVDITVVRVPGAFEIPPVAERLAWAGRFDGVICLGAVIRGATPHFDHVAAQSASGVSRVARRSPIPVIYGILTTDSVEQAVDRAGAKSGNRGADAALAAVELANLYRTLPPDRRPLPAAGRVAGFAARGRRGAPAVRRRRRR